MATIRKIIEIDEALCNGCGMCIPSCAEGALVIVDGKAKVLEDKYCDGLGACLGECPEGALTIVEREADPFDEEAVEELLAKQKEKTTGLQSSGGCPSAQMSQFAPGASVTKGPVNSALSHWPVQIRLVPANASFLKDSDLLVAADCVPVAFPSFHKEMLEGKTVMIGCPKFDDQQMYLTKFTEIFMHSGIKSLTVVSMEVPCCAGLPALIEKAKAMAGSDIPVHHVIVGTQGHILPERPDPTLVRKRIAGGVHHGS